MMWPFKNAPPKEDWRLTDEQRWAVVETAGVYEKQRLMEKIVRFPDGATKWVPVQSNIRVPRKIFRIVKLGGKTG